MRHSTKTRPDVEARQAAAEPVRAGFDFTNLHPDQNLSEREVCVFLNISRSHLRNKINPRSPYFDPSFPEPHGMRGQAKEGRSVRWKAGLIIGWNRSQPSCSYAR